MCLQYGILLFDTFLFPQSYWKVPEDHIILINLFCTPAAARRIVDENPNVRSTFLPGALRQHFYVLHVLHPSDDRPNNGASLSDPKSLRPALLRHRSCGLRGSIHVGRAYWTAAIQCCCFAVIWIYGLCCHQSWEFNIVHYASKSFSLKSAIFTSNNPPEKLQLFRISLQRWHMLYTEEHGLALPCRRHLVRWRSMSRSRPMSDRLCLGNSTR